MQEITKAFPDSIKVKNSGRLVEFVPDGAGDGFAGSANVPAGTLKDFAYLYVYFFSEYALLDEWRGRTEAKNAAHRLLLKPEYQDCRNDDNREAARCVLRRLSHGGQVKLIFVRYDEGHRAVLPENIEKELAEKKPALNQH